jgi:hypothetical protein
MESSAQLISDASAAPQGMVPEKWSALSSLNEKIGLHGRGFILLGTLFVVLDACRDHIHDVILSVRNRQPNFSKEGLGENHLTMSFHATASTSGLCFRARRETAALGAILGLEWFINDKISHAAQ